MSEAGLCSLIHALRNDRADRHAVSPSARSSSAAAAYGPSCSWLGPSATTGTGFATVSRSGADVDNARRAREATDLLDRMPGDVQSRPKARIRESTLAPARLRTVRRGCASRTGAVTTVFRFDDEARTPEPIRLRRPSPPRCSLRGWRRGPDRIAKVSMDALLPPPSTRFDNTSETKPSLKRMGWPAERRSVRCTAPSARGAALPPRAALRAREEGGSGTHPGNEPLRTRTPRRSDLNPVLG